MQQKFGEDSIWVYEILRYAIVSPKHCRRGWLTCTALEVLIGAKVRPGRLMSHGPSRRTLLPFISEGEARNG
jgi:hypothetical protein